MPNAFAKYEKNILVSNSIEAMKIASKKFWQTDALYKILRFGKFFVY